MIGPRTRHRRVVALALTAIGLLAPASAAHAGQTNAAAVSQCAQSAGGQTNASARALSDGFESGNLDAWSRARGSARVSTAASFRGRYGLAARGGRRPSSVLRRVDPSARLTINLCWRAPSRGPVRIARLVETGSVVTYTRARRLSLRVRGASTRTRRKTRLRPRRWVAVRVDSNVRTGVVKLIVNGRTEAWAKRRRLPAETGAEIGQIGPSRGPAPAPPVAIDGVSVNSRPATPSGSSQPPATPQPPAGSLADRPFAPTSFWNKPLAPSAALAPDSQQLVGELVRQTNAYDPWMNTTAYSTPVYRVPAGQPTVRVKLDTWGPDLQATWDAVPIPPNAQPAGGTDKHMVVWQPSTDTMWEFWLADKKADGWHARWGGTMTEVSKNPGYFTHRGQTNNWGATATGIALHGGLITLDELRRGRIDHALALSVVEAKRAAHVWPAQRDDGYSWTQGIHAIPEGTRFRLDPSVDVDKMNALPIVKMLARAAQDYGIVVRDKAGAVTFYGEDPKPSGTNPWGAIWNGGWTNQVLRSQFPWAKLQVVDPSVR